MSITDYKGYEGGIESPASGAFAISTSDTNNLSIIPRAIYIGGAGDIKVDMENGGTVTFSGVPAGTVFPIRVKKVHSTGTTATNLIALT